MGKFEKLVVLTVLFVAAIVLAISFNRGSGEVAASDPLSGARELLDQEGLAAPEVQTPPTSPEATTGNADSEAAPSLFLNAGMGDSSPEAGTDGAPTAGLRATTPGETGLSLEPMSDPTQRILGDVPGLRPSFLDEYMMYTVVEGDTWSGLAQRFYQDGQYTRNLHIANEDMPELVPGKPILVPVFDFLAEASEPAPGAEPMTLAQPSGATPPASDVAPVTKSSVPDASGTKRLEYEVRPGDTLSDISLAVFGTATRWQEILAANTDKLAKPESLQVGMKLKIPEGGKLPVAGAAKSSAPAKKETKSEPKPKTAKATDKPATAKKKKVL